MRKSKIAGMVTALVLTAAMLTGCNLNGGGTRSLPGRRAVGSGEIPFAVKIACKTARIVPN